MRLIDADALKEEVNKKKVVGRFNTLSLIDNAPTVETKELTPLENKVVEVLPELNNAIVDSLPEIVSKLIKCSECSYYRDTWNIIPRPQGEREFIEILTNYPPEDLCTYPEYRGKPYYSIRYRENGEEFVGYGTYKIEVLSRYLQDYFFGASMKGGAE